MFARVAKSFTQGPRMFRNTPLQKAERTVMLVVLFWNLLKEAVETKNEKHKYQLKQMNSIRNKFFGITENVCSLFF